MSCTSFGWLSMALKRFGFEPDRTVVVGERAGRGEAQHSIIFYELVCMVIYVAFDNKSSHF